MCKFHKEVSRMVATAPGRGIVSAPHEAVIRVALSRYWQERYVEGAELVDGYSPYPMATLSQQAAFEASGLKKPMDVVEREMQDGIKFLQSRLVALEMAQGPLTIESLGLPIAPARDAFIDKALLDFYRGDPKGDFRFADTPSDPILIPIHRAVSFFQNDPQSREVLERMVTGRICALYSAAPHQVNQKVMNAYERLPQRAKDFLQKVGQFGGNILLGGFSGIAGHGVHYGSVLGAGAVSGLASTSANIALSGTFLVASYGIWDRVFGGRYRSGPEKRNAFIVQAALTAAVAFAGQALMGGHDHGQGGHEQHQHNHHHGNTDATRQRVDKLLAQAQPHELVNWNKTAKEQGWTLEEYLTNICVTLEVEKKEGAQPVFRPE